MTTDTTSDADLDRPEPILSTPPTPVIANTGFAEPTCFEHVLAYSYRNDIATITLTSERPLVDVHGAPYKDDIVTGMLKAPIGALLQLQNAIEGVLRLRDEAAAHMPEVPASGLAH